MTAPHRCGAVVADPFSDWLRNNPRLDSRNYSLSATDCDMWVHKFKNIVDGRADRQLQCIMLVEVKTRLAAVEFAQRDTLGLVNALMRRGDRMVARNERGDRFRVRSFGVHFLQMSGACPTDSEAILWDGHAVSVQQLERILRFELHPTTLVPNPLRNHHRPQLVPQLPGIGAHVVRRD